MEKKLQKIHPTYHNLLTAQDLWQAHHQILSIIFLKRCIKLNVNTSVMMTKCETCRIKFKYCDYFLEYIDLKDDLVDYKCLYCNTSSQQKFDEKFK